MKRSEIIDGSYATVAESVYANSYIDTTVINDITYYFVVSAVNDMGESDNSAVVSATPCAPIVIPNAPANLTATSGDTKVDLTWSTSQGAATYTVKKSTAAGGTYTTIAENISGITYSDTSVTNGTTYYYAVTAVNTARESGLSNESSAMPEEPE